MDQGGATGKMTESQRSRKVRRRQNKIREKTNARQRANTIRHRKDF